jgi:hypothetical protein
MSLFSNVANYGGKQGDNQQGIKQFVVNPQTCANWILSTILSSGEKFITPENKDKNVYVSKDFHVLRDLYVERHVYNLSDMNKKTNIEKISSTDTLNLDLLEPVTFQYLSEEKDEKGEKDEKDEKKHYGLIAQQVEKVYPNLIVLVDECKHLNYMELIPILISRMKEMQKEINELKCHISKEKIE